jgi:glucosamine-6-phosphate deaminase
VRKKPISDADVQIVTRLLDEVRPHQIYAAGDLSDPHGTHRVCLAIVLAALRGLSGGGPSRPAGGVRTPNATAKPAWLRECTMWCYRGAWQEWAPHEIDLAVPLSPDEVERKRFAIFKHQSQKDEALFPGPWDDREFWQRAEDRNRNTAKLFDRLGLPEYEAIEAFARWGWRTENSAS